MAYVQVPTCFHKPGDPILQLTPEGLGPWSISKLKLLQKCPLQFYLKYIRKIKEEIVRPDDDRMLAHVGSALHDVLDQTVSGTPLKRSFARARQKFQKDIPQDHWDEVVLRQEYNILNFLDRLDSFKREHKVQKVWTEQRIGLTRDYQPTGFFAEDVYWRGVLDLALLTGKGDVILIDHKSGGSAKFGLRNYEFQLDTYKPAFHYGVCPVKGAQSGIFFVKEGEIALGQYTPVEDIPEQMRMFEFYIQGAIERVLTDGYFKYERGSMCKYCDFKEKCSGGKRGTSGELQRFEEESKLVVERFKETQE